VLAASNRSLETAVRTGCFREDLFYRLSVVQILLPPLREREEDLLLLAMHFLNPAAAEAGHPPRRFSGAARRKLLAHAWPGNVRELENVIARTMVFTRASVIEEKDISLQAAEPGPIPGDYRSQKRAMIESFERGFLTDLMRRHGGNVSRAAREAGKERHSFLRILQKYGFASSQDMRRIPTPSRIGVHSQGPKPATFSKAP
jgi:DNA-binding NtrC family response regulator